jgi:hypothetical protein
MLVQESIVVEDRIEEIVNTMPLLRNAVTLVVDMPVFFKKGPENEINSYLAKSNEPYPLIWLAYPFVEKHINYKKVEVRNMTIVIATKGNVSKLLDDRFDYVYRKTLMNVFNNLRYRIDKANTVSLTEEYSITKVPNYKMEQKQNSIDVWDAIKVTFDCNINDRCLII